MKTNLIVFAYVCIATAAVLTCVSVRMRAPAAASATTPPTPSAAASAAASTAPAPVTSAAPTASTTTTTTTTTTPVDDALHVYAYDCARRLLRAYVDRSEDDDLREARLKRFAYDIADAVEDAKVDPPEAWTVALIFLAHRETVLARVPREVGNEDEGLAAGPWQIHEWRHGMDRFKAKTALDLLKKAPGAWSLPSPRPWEGIVAQPRLGRPSVAEYLKRYPFST